ncbi:MAG TPA: hypothetical protein VLT57_16245 [Bryobacteraceae bacterium]|nr:hypothetical protein [Bryobacteraceae bacterium]
MAEIAELIERMERASGSDRELDVCIARLTSIEGQRVTDDGRVEYWVGVENDFGPGWYPAPVEIPHYSSSIDAALSLVPEWWEYTLTTIYGSAHAEIPLNDTRVDAQNGEHKGGSMPIAVCISALKAIAALRSRSHSVGE